VENGVCDLLIIKVLQIDQSKNANICRCTPKYHFPDPPPHISMLPVNVARFLTILESIHNFHSQLTHILMFSPINIERWGGGGSVSNSMSNFILIVNSWTNYFKVTYICIFSTKFFNHKQIFGKFVNVQVYNLIWLILYFHLKLIYPKLKSLFSKMPPERFNWLQVRKKIYI